ncbi:MAG: RNA polymerase sigma factor [Turneriella sp.]
MGWIDIPNTEIERAVAGNSAALERILRATQQPVYNLALRFLWHPQDAQDNTQEILIKVMTNLSVFRSESAYGTWVYRIAVNHLLRAKKSRAERREVSFRDAARTLSVQEEPPAETDVASVVNDVKIACSHAMLIALKRKYRMAFVLGAVMQLTGDEAAKILELSPAAYRQRLSRARTAMAEFLGRNCGLVNTSAPCHCEKRIAPCLRSGAIEPYRALAEKLRDSKDFARTQAELGGEISHLEKVTLLYRSNGSYAIPDALDRRIRSLIDGRLFAS